MQAWSEISASTGQDITARSISITDVAGPSSTGIYTPTGVQHISTTGAAANGYGITIENLGASGTDQNNASPASAYIYDRTGTQSIDVANSRGVLLKGTGGLAFLGTNGPAQTIDIHGSGTNALDLLAGTGGANLYFGNSTPQTNQGQSITASSLSLTGGTQNGAYASIDAANGNQTVTLTGALSLHGGSAAGPASANADTPPSSTTANSGGVSLLSRHGKQTITAASISLTGGAGGSENFANILSNGGQDFTIGAGGLTMTGGTGTGFHNYAFVENYGGDQIVHLAAGSPLTITGGTVGIRNYAGIWGGGPISYTNTIAGVPDLISTGGTTSQQILGNANITIRGGATGGGGNGTEQALLRRGNTGFIIAQTGPQQIGAGTITLTGGGGAGENSAVIDTFSAGAAQTINATGTVSLTGGSALYANAEISSGGAQTINAGGLTLAGGNAGGAGLAFAEVSSATGFDQTITLPTNAVLSLTGGSGGVGNSAHIESGRNQTIDGNPVVTLAGGTGASSDVSIQNETGGTQSFHFGALTITGGSGLDASAAVGVGGQSTIVEAGQTHITGGTGNGATRLDVIVTGDVVLTGGSGPDAKAVLSGNDVTVSAANVFLTGGAGDRSFAAIGSVSGNTTVTAAGKIVMLPGTGVDADASIVGQSGVVTLNAASCTGCVTLGSNPLHNNATEQGVFGVPVVFNIASATVPVDPSIIYAAGISSDGGQANTNYLTSATDEEEGKKQKPSGNEGKDSGNKPKRTIPVCM